MDANAINPDVGSHRSHTHRWRRALRRRWHHRPPPVTAGTTRLYLAGDDSEVAHLFTGSALDVVRLTGAPPAASALKMTYAAWTKTTAALLVSIRRTAAAYVVDDDLLDEWAISQPHLVGAWLQARQQTDEKGWRWSYELAEVGKTFAAVGQPEGFGAAASEVFATSSNEDLPGRRWTLAGSTHFR